MVSVNIVTHVHVMMGNSVMSQAMHDRALLWTQINYKHGTGIEAETRTLFAVPY